MQLAFHKMHGLGNDFIIVDCLNNPYNCLNFSALATKLCDRHYAIGADGLIAILPSDIADVRMRIFNSDGSEAQMCGNGIRCVGKYIFDNHIIPSLQPAIETAVGIKRLNLVIADDGKVSHATVNMGKAEFEQGEISRTLTTPYGKFNVIPVSTGNPHGVIFVNDLSHIDVQLIGPELENHPYWADRANIEFVEIASPHRFRQLTWERGAGQTLACGTGACASTAAAVASARCRWPIEVQLAGGTLSIDSDADGNILMTGPATYVFSGLCRLDDTAC